MSLTRKMLKAMGVEDEKIDQIIEAHTESTDALKADRDKYKEEVEKLSVIEKEKTDLEKERDELQKKVDEMDDFKEKYESEKQSFEDYKKDVDAERETVKKTEAYKSLLREAGVSDKRIDQIIRVTAVDEIELDDGGGVKDSDTVIESIKEDWSEFIVTESKQGVKTENPPANDGGDGKMTKDEIMDIKDRAARQKAIAENPDLFGIAE